MFSRYSLLSEVCLGVAFTGQTFKNDVIGVSYSAVPASRHHFRMPVGGICDRPFMNQPDINLNTLVVSAGSENDKPMPQYILHLSLSHELGHSFGSDHDYTEECKGHLMTDHTPEKPDRKRFVFSSCSKRMILETIFSKGHCLEDYGDNFCGNGRVESGEECDCGTTKDCEHFDDCCIPRGTVPSCQIRRDRGYQCHPSQGLCCSLECRFKDLSKYNLDCNQFQDSCPCRNNRSKDCSCGIKARCTGNTCSSEECTRLNLKECVRTKDTSRKSCQTYCSFNGTCMSSRFLSERLLQKSELLWSELIGKDEVKPGKFEFIEKICRKNACVSLNFRKAMVNDYCLLFGQLGICGQNFRCHVPDSNIYPNIPTHTRSESSSSIFKSEIKHILGCCLILFSNKIIL